MSRLLVLLLLLGTVKISLLISLGVIDRTPQEGAVSKEAGSASLVSECREPNQRRSWPVRAALAQEPQQGARQAQNSSSLSEEWEALKKEKRRLQRRRKDLQELETRLDEKLAQEKRLKERLEQTIKEARVLKDEKIKHLVDVYSNMQPEQAAKVLETLDQGIAVKILAGMRGRTAGEILSFVQAEKAARLSEELTDFQTPFVQE